MYFKMSPQIPCLQNCAATDITFIGFFSIVTLLMCFQIASRLARAKKNARPHRLHFFDLSPLCVFKCYLKLLATEEAKAHWLHLFVILVCTLILALLKIKSLNGKGSVGRDGLTVLKSILPC